MDALFGSHLFGSLLTHLSQWVLFSSEIPNLFDSLLFVCETSLRTYSFLNNRSKMNLRRQPASPCRTTGEMVNGEFLGKVPVMSVLVA
jgi:hypothetical protein